MVETVVEFIKGGLGELERIGQKPKGSAAREEIILLAKLFDDNLTYPEIPTAPAKVSDPYSDVERNSALIRQWMAHLKERGHAAQENDARKAMALLTEEFDNTARRVGISTIFRDAESENLRVNSTSEDLAFLVHNHVVLRFQESVHDVQLEERGYVSGNAYSLAYPGMWHPATSEKAQIFKRELRHVIDDMFIFIQGHISTGSSLILFKDVFNARLPVLGDHETYPPPFYRTGVTQFRKDQEIGRVSITGSLVYGQFGISNTWEDTQDQREKVKRLKNYLTEQVITQIQDARSAAPDQTLPMRDDQARLSHIMAIERQNEKFGL